MSLDVWVCADGGNVEGLPVIEAHETEPPDPIAAAIFRAAIPRTVALGEPRS
jgi:hypothetical protein